MGTCRYCGEKAGFLRSKHIACLEKREQALGSLPALVCEELVQRKDPGLVMKELVSLACQSFIREDEATDLMVRGFDLLVSRMLDDGVFSGEEESYVGALLAAVPDGEKALETNGSLSRVTKSAILREVMEGKKPTPRLRIPPEHPFLLQASEEIIWMFLNVDYFEMRTRTEYVGRSQGFNIRIAKGIYYKVGAFQGNPISVDHLQPFGSGMLALTTKHLYFASAVKNFRVPYQKMVTLQAYDDGIGFQKEGVSSVPQIFRNIDSWFCYNLVANLTKNAG